LGCGLPDDAPLSGKCPIPGDIIDRYAHVKGHGSLGDFPADSAQPQQPESFAGEFTSDPTMLLTPLDDGILYTTFAHFLSACTPCADKQAHVLIGSHLGTHTHSHVDTRPALGATSWLLDLFAQCVTVIVVRGGGVA